MPRWICRMFASRLPTARMERAPCMVHMEIDTASARTLRRVVMRTGADAVRFLRIGGCGKGGRVTALLCVDADAADNVRQEVARFLPDCQYRSAV